MRLDRARADGPEVPHLPTSCMEEERAVVEEAPNEGEGFFWVSSLPHLCQALTTSAYHVKSETGSIRELTDVVAHVWNVGPRDCSESSSIAWELRWPMTLVEVGCYGKRGWWPFLGIIMRPTTDTMECTSDILLSSGKSDPSMLSFVGRFGPWERLRAQSFWTSLFIWPRLQVILETG